MKARSLICSILLAGGSATCPAAENHREDALMQTQAAIEQGALGHANLLVEHAEAALWHAEEAEKAQPSPHMAQGISHLKAALDEARKNHAQAATDQARQAFQVMDQKP